MKIKLEKRSPGTITTLYITFLSIILALGVSALIFESQGVNPLIAYKEIFVGAFGSVYGFSETVVKAIPLILCGVGLSIAFRAKIWNIGAEGQLLMGAVAATWIALNNNIPPNLKISLMFIVGFMCGAIWALIPGFLRAKLNANEVITTLMMNYIAMELVKYLVVGPWKGAGEWGFPQTSIFPKSAWIPTIAKTRIHYLTLIIAFSSTIFTYILFVRTKVGYEIKVVGDNPEAARYAGISHFKIVMLVMLLSGGLAGIAGVGEVAGIHHRLRPPEGISAGYGYTAIIVSWLGKLNPLGVIVASILFGGLLVGGDAIQVSLGLPSAVINIFNGAILTLILIGEYLANYKIKFEFRGG